MVDIDPTAKKWVKTSRCKSVKLYSLMLRIEAVKRARLVSAALLAGLSIGLVGCGGSTAVEKDAKAESAQPAAAQDEKKEEQKQDIVDTAVAAGSFKTLAAALKAGELIETLKSDGPFTVFAPTDDAFGKLPKGTVETLLKPENRDQLVGILTYHVVKGSVPSTEVVKLDSTNTVNGAAVAISQKDGSVLVNSAKVVTADIQCSNGIIHVIDEVILPPKPAAEKSHDGVSLSIEGVGTFKTLFAAIDAAGLKETLSTKGPFTVFAPTDEAFAALPEGTLAELLKPENKAKLASILTYHVVAGTVKAEDVLKLDSAKTVNGQEVSIKVADGEVHVGGARVLKTDVDCNVGLIHAIDKVLLPKD